MKLFLSENDQISNGTLEHSLTQIKCICSCVSQLIIWSVTKIVLLTTRLFVHDNKNIGKCVKNLIDFYG